MHSGDRGGPLDGASSARPRKSERGRDCPARGVERSCAALYLTSYSSSSRGVSLDTLRGGQVAYLCTENDAVESWRPFEGVQRHNITVAGSMLIAARAVRLRSSSGRERGHRPGPFEYRRSCSSAIPGQAHRHEVKFVTTSAAQIANMAALPRRLVSIRLRLFQPRVLNTTNRTITICPVAFWIAFACLIFQARVGTAIQPAQSNPCSEVQQWKGLVPNFMLSDRSGD
jgi:hypothetical protein